MSDSDEDLMPNNVLNYHHERVNGVHSQGPNRNNNTHITNFSMRNNNMISSTFDMQNYERQRYRGAFDQRSMCYRRETSPMSLRSFRDPGMRNFHNSYYRRGMSSQRSVFNGRSGSPMSVRSIDSNATSVSAADIALAFRNVKFNKYDLRLIREAYSKFMKNRVRKRIEKRRNLKLFLKGTRKDTGYDSGELGSDSSISSDDCRSTRTAIYKENLPIPIPRSKPYKTDMTQLRNTIQESDMYQDCTENLKQNSLKNMLFVKNTQVDVGDVTNTTIAKPQNGSLVSLKARFAKGNSFTLPSQRFTKSGNKPNKVIGKSGSNTMQTRQALQTDRYLKETARDKSFESNSGDEEIFPEVTIRENIPESTLLQRKRNLDIEETNNSSIKRKKFTSPIKPPNETLISSTVINTQNDFAFKKPQMPLRLSMKGKNTIFNDKLIAKSAPPLVDDFEPDFSLHSNKQAKNQDTNLQCNSKQQVTQNNESEDTNNDTEVSQNTTNVSMRPSFIKRKLFSQKLDVLDKKNQSTDNLALNSPQTKLYAGEKNKVRKLASSQSCLNLDVLGNDNVLDLIHKIVPRDKINITNQNKKETRKSQDDDKWDVTSVISMCNNDDVSDTFTDEEIFKVSQSTAKNNVNDKDKISNLNGETNQSKKVTKQKTNETPKNKNTTKKPKPIQCEVILEKLSPKIYNNYDGNKPIQNQNKRTVSSCVKSFWDTDFESDMEERPHTTWNLKFPTGKNHEINPVINNTINLPKKNCLKGTILTVRSTQNKTINSSSRSDRSRVSQRKIQNDNQENIDQNEAINKKSNCEVNLNTSVTELNKKRGRPKKKDLNNSNSAQKCTSKNKETSKKQKKCDVKKTETIKRRILTPRKVNEKKLLSSPMSSQSSFNCSNISSRSLRVRNKPPS